MRSGDPVEVQGVARYGVITAASPRTGASRGASSRASKAGAKMVAPAEAKYFVCGQLTIYRSEVCVIWIYGES